ncbi:hypothetical protein [Caballeronia hypogeia]|uniref:hypothetical protein n=1 Tax=Caballeronia hypogeia TaxID=1777140 RepID=UPI00077290EB|nr:hypothetical protein [Caballeronia hypogeia]
MLHFAFEAASSNIVRLPDVQELPREFVHYRCGWISKENCWLVIRYRDESMAAECGGETIFDMIAAPADIAAAFATPGPTILGGVLMAPTTSDSPPWTSNPVSELWISHDEQRTVVLVVTPRGRRLFLSSDSTATDFELMQVYPRNTCSRSQGRANQLPQKPML